MTTEFYRILIRNLVVRKILINILIRKLDDHGILVKFQRNFDQNYFQELDDQGILMKFFNDFDQNSGGQP
jgi:hypothetical protein